MGSASICNQSSHWLTGSREDNLITVLYHFDKRGKFSFGLRDIPDYHGRMISDQIWSGQPKTRRSLNRFRKPSLPKTDRRDGLNHGRTVALASGGRGCLSWSLILILLLTRQLGNHHLPHAVGPHVVNKFPLFVLAPVADNMDPLTLRGAGHAGNAGRAAGYSRYARRRLARCSKDLLDETGGLTGIAGSRWWRNRLAGARLAGVLLERIIRLSRLASSWIGCKWIVRLGRIRLLARISHRVSRLSGILRLLARIYDLSWLDGDRLPRVLHLSWLDGIGGLLHRILRRLTGRIRLTGELLKLRRVEWLLPR